MAKILTMGELLLRLTPVNHQRLNIGGHFTANYGGAEANVAVSLSRFGHDVSFLSAFPPNDIGDAALSHLQASGVDTSSVFRLGERLGIYFYEEGFSLRQGKVIYDRKASSVLELPDQYIDWDQVYDEVDLLHVTGITPALSKGMKEFTLAGIQEAKKRNVQVSFDFNYRSKLWGVEEAKETFLAILPHVDICFAGYKDFVYLLGFEGPDEFDKETLERFYREFAELYKIKYLASTRRTVFSTSKNELTGYIYFEDYLYESDHVSFEILDRIGGGDAFASGVLHTIISGLAPEEVIEFGIGSGVLKHMVYGDYNQFSEEEVEAFLANRDKDVNR
ncbi:sugar kinase [Lentibacillus jeotgali]|uniref:sugar kinase n=1 Tax=Lentibacillus jeotgali TaxID=558169 RepID=UPI0002627402|nr:sugar kinase [Lentibacillus jeotgali]